MQKVTRSAQGMLRIKRICRKDTLYLDGQQKVKLTLNITPGNEVAQKSQYQILSCQVMGGLSEMLADKTKKN